MKIRILQENLIKSVQDSMKFISNKPQIPILSCILLEAKEGKLHLKATDLAVSIHSTVGCKVEQEGEAAVSGRVFADLLSTLPAGPVDMFVDGGKLMIRAAKVKSSVALSESKEFPPFPEEKGKKISLSKKKLSSLLELGGIAAGVDETRPMFSCLRFECAEDELAVVATDGYRLSRKHEKISAGATEGVMVSARMMREAERILERLPGDNVEMSISEEVGQVFFRTEDCSISLRMISGDYPNYQAIVPAECGVVVEMNVEELLAAIKTAMVFSREVSGIITLKIAGNVLSVASVAASGDSDNEVDVKMTKGSAGEISFNGKYLLDFLGVIKTGTIVFSMNESLKPGMFTMPSEKNFYYVVMPFRVAGGN